MLVLGCIISIIIFVMNIVNNPLSSYNLDKLSIDELNNKKYKNNRLFPYAVAKKKYELLKYLLKRKVRPLDEFEISFGIAIRVNDCKFAKIMINEAKKNTIDIFTYLTVLGPWRKESMKMINFLESEGLDFNKKSIYGNKLGAFALYTKADNIRDYIVKKSAPFENNDMNQSLIMDFILQDNIKSAQALLNNGVSKSLYAEIYLKDLKNFTHNINLLAAIKSDATKHQEIIDHVFLTAIVTDDLAKIKYVYQKFADRLTKEIEVGDEYLTPLEYATLRKKQNAIKFIEEKLK